MNVYFSLFVLSVCLTTALSGTHPDGVSKVSREQDALGNYKFSYAVSNPEGEHFREEGTDHLGRVIGSYGLSRVDGTHRVVDYVADKNGFRAEVRSNEPGVISAESADASISKLHGDLPLSVAATSVEDSESPYGTRLNADSSRVSYTNEADKSSDKEQLGNMQREIRQRNYEDYRPKNPVAYYPSGTLDTARPLESPTRSSPNAPSRSQIQNPSGESRPLDVYLPPIDPHTAARRPSYFIPRERVSDQSPYSTTSRRPFIPPYGGFDDDPPSVIRRPGVSMSTIHGGLGSDDFDSTSTSTPTYGAGRYPADDTRFSREFINPHFPSRSNFPPLPRLPGGLLSPPPRRMPGPIFRPPSYNTRLSPPNFVLRAVPIPNGIQAVRVDPETGRVYDRLMYPLYLKDGQPVYDKNVLLHNDDVSDDAVIRNHDPGYFDIAFQRRPPFRSIRNTAFDAYDDFGNVTRRFNQTFDPQALSVPTARDLEWIRRQLSQVEGFDRNRYSNPSYFRNAQFENNEYPLFNDFDDSVDENPDSEEDLYPQIRNSERSFSRDPRLIDRLSPEDTKEIASKSESIIDSKSSETNPKPTIVEKS